jgi:hypothetical protein
LHIINLKNPGGVKTLTIKILEVFEGSKFKPAAISEVLLFKDKVGE